MLSHLPALSTRRLAVALAALTALSAVATAIYPHLIFRMAVVVFSVTLLGLVSYAEWKRGDEGPWGALAKEASADVVQAELASMRGAAWASTNEMTAQAGVSSIIAEIDQEFAGIDAGRDTPPSVLNTLIARYPRTPEIKG